MSNPTVGQPLDFNPHGWTRPWLRPGSGAAYVEANGLAAEDWNFDTTQAIKSAKGAYMYGYGQGKIAPKREDKAGGVFDVLFYHRDEDGDFFAVGLYRNATYVREEEAAAAWAELEEAGHVKTRRTQLRRALAGYPTMQKRACDEFDKGGHVRWRVRVDDVIAFERPYPQITPLRPTDHKHGTAYEWTDHPWSGLGPAVRPSKDSVHEGGLVTVAHQSRERDPSLRKKVLAARRKALGAGASLCCEACGLDAGAKYGSALQDFVEVHHSVPLHTFAATGGKVQLNDLALLCPTCHRVAHRTGRWTVAELKTLLADAGPRT
jgi:hypothetical protein